MVEKNIAIIPARGGSKRIPKKNIVEFNAKPMIAWTIEAALKTKLFDEVIVSTDYEEIAEISRAYGAQVPFLRKKTNDDISPVSLATLEALEQSEEFFNKKYDNVVQLMANTPLRTSEDIKKMFDYFKKNDYEALLSSFKFGWMNPWWAFEKDDDDRAKMKFPEAIKQRSQDLPDLYCPTGAIWMSKCEVLKKHKNFYSPNHRFYEIDWKSAVDIDDYDDLEFAKVISQLK
jgi:N-acylneuraminate cytidylyltransferase